MKESLESDTLQHALQVVHGDALLVFVAFHFFADQVKRVQHIEHRIDQRGRPSQNERAAGTDDAMRFAEHGLGIRQMLQHCQHHDVVEARVWKWQRRAEIGANALPATLGAAFNLVIDANTIRDLAGGILKEGRLKPAAKIAHARPFADVRRGRAETPASNETIDDGICHYLRSWSPM